MDEAIDLYFDPENGAHEEWCERVSDRIEVDNLEIRNTHDEYFARGGDPPEEEKDPYDPGFPTNLAGGDR
jgi:hypothetical protein